MVETEILSRNTLLSAIFSASPISNAQLCRISALHYPTTSCLSNLQPLQMVQRTIKILSSPRTPQIALDHLFDPNFLFTAMFKHLLSVCGSMLHLAPLRALSMVLHSFYTCGFSMTLDMCLYFGSNILPDLDGSGCCLDRCLE